MGAVRWMLMLWLATVVISTAVVAWAVLWHRLDFQRESAQLRAAFDALWFDTPIGRVTGQALTVVKVAYQIDEALLASAMYTGPARWDALWYAAGPGPSYFLAVCVLESGKPMTPPRWIVRTLDEPHMRAALNGDRNAQMLAFNEAIQA
ncbi:hypothetical protein QLQ15_16060 [Lysobacter sp. LF1]|uniref:DUF3592 domain-containing protein n=1 Tax=Lysobacter stagni TaxID=3045172 RepID=A0ABT6XJV9_9GAMM|nr:hypothetical protein [Lysobacter sp. LF1]MDI9240422.1 hypothetical protein [Lysobacter sp. LF1]